jgi:hypothetical protein
MDIVSPVIASTVIRDRNDKDFPESFISLSSKPNLEEANFFSVIFPEAKPISGDFGSRPVTTKIEARGWIGARVENNGKTFYGFFKTDSNATANVEGYVTDARQFTTSVNNDGSIQTAYFEGRLFGYKDVQVKSELPVSCAISLLNSSAILEIQTEKATGLSVSFEKMPAKVALNGKQLKQWHYDKAGKLLSLNVPEGKHVISVN